MSGLIDLSLVQAVQALRKGDISSRLLIEAYLERINQLDAKLHAFLAIAPEKALAQAEAADRRLQAWRRHPEEPLPALLGIPVAVKDVLCVAGMPCTCGSRILEEFYPPFHATVVERLLSAGAIILGKTNTDEFAMGSSTENSAYGVTHNPWDLERVPGGSSGGSAAAVAARLALVALGTDTGGSVRQPASFCGVTGIKPTYGRVSRYGLVAYGSSLDVVGVLGRDVQDVASVFSQIAGYDTKDATTLDLPVPGMNVGEQADLSGLRVGVPEEYFIPGMQAEVEEVVRQAIHMLEKLGAQLKPVSMPHTRYALPVYYIVAPAEASANLARYDGIRYGPRVPAQTLWGVFRQTRGQKFGPEVKRRIMLGTYALSAGYYEAYYGQAQKVRTLIKQDFDAAFKDVDVIAAPVAPTTAFKIGGHGDDPLSMYLEDVFTLPANLAGVPGLAFPVGFDQQGLPVGMQLMGPHFREELLFRTAFTYQRATEWHKNTPEMVA
ncbi:MAG: Asp-tRNA(Asn)/Glu-tRNA(Gln) amidotransferase subunit GatA [Anaerolineales bacterium]|nr:MAG: Asp-tRNA(Asn)/Glu-tRNA(Gln) amidotransferase subunit GatA [Anaerolineales bacterium]